MRDSSVFLLSSKSSITIADMVLVKQRTEDLKDRSPVRMMGMWRAPSLSFIVYALFSNCMLGTERREPVKHLIPNERESIREAGVSHSLSWKVSAMMTLAS